MKHTCKGVANTTQHRDPDTWGRTLTYLIDQFQEVAVHYLGPEHRMTLLDKVAELRTQVDAMEEKERCTVH